MADRGHEVLLISTDRPRAMRARVFYPAPGSSRWRFLPKLRAAFAHGDMARATQEFRPDFVHMHWLNASMLSVMQARHWRRLIISVWGTDVIWDVSEHEPWLRRTLRRRIAAQAEIITATSEFLAGRTQAIVGLSARPTVVPFGIDTEAFSPGAKRAAGGEIVIGYLKHYMPRYGPEIAVRSMLRVRAAIPGARLEMYGAGDQAGLERLVGELGLGDAVRVHGPVAHAEVAGVMRGFDIYCMPSLSESFGVSALEASACGVSVVASDVGGVPEVVVDGQTGVLVRSGDVNGLADALIRLAGDATAREQMGAAGRAFVVGRYRWADSVTAMEGVYERMMVNGR